jgi:fructose-1-phosphate kinase PfkB-like protein
MIITVTLNPSLDRTLELDRLAQGCVQRVVHILSAPVPALLTRITEGES